MTDFFKGASKEYFFNTNSHESKAEFSRINNSCKFDENSCLFVPKGLLRLTAITLFFIFSFSSFAFCADEVTITTYYPSPYGVYKELRLHPNDAPNVCNAANKGAVYYSDLESQMKVCNGTTWNNLGGGASMRTGSYTGTGLPSGSQRGIAHGLGVVPKLVVITALGGVITGILWIIPELGPGTFQSTDAPYSGTMSVDNPDATNFYVGPGGSEHFANTNTVEYRWVAIGN